MKYPGTLKLAIVLLFAMPGLSATSFASSHEPEPFAISQAEIEKVPSKFRRAEVDYSGPEKPGTIVVDTANRYLYLVTAQGRAMRYGIGVGRQGFSWAGQASINHKAKWPRWTPPKAMVARDPEAAKWANGMPGGPRNPLGARALYLFQGGVDTLYRIHGTFQPASIGRAVSSGCIRLLNADVADLYERVPLGTKVVVRQARRLDAPEAVAQKQAPEAVAEKQTPGKPKPAVLKVKRNFNL